MRLRDWACSLEREEGEIRKTQLVRKKKKMGKKGSSFWFPTAHGSGEGVPGRTAVPKSWGLKAQSGRQCRWAKKKTR